MTGVLQKWGNSVALRIPKAALQKANLREGLRVTVEVDRNRIILEEDTSRRSSLSELVMAITTDNRHEEMWNGEPQGKELW